jgi:hypothetical protein
MRGGTATVRRVPMSMATRAFAGLERFLSTPSDHRWISEREVSC